MSEVLALAWRSPEAGIVPLRGVEQRSTLFLAEIAVAAFVLGEIGVCWNST